jgi:hypothetical protein
MGASEWGKPPSALRAKGVEKEEEEQMYEEICPQATCDLSEGNERS